MIVLVAVLFFAYQNVTEELMRTVNCVDLDKVQKPPYETFAIATDSYWAEDTSLKCFEGDHQMLAFILGIPGLIFFAFGIPFSLLLFLLLNKHRAFKENDFINTYGFVYQNYNESHIYWEVIILLRKGLIGAIVVFGYEAGANLQGIMALGVLIVALVVHFIAVPFRYKVLNVLEGMSLVVSITTFYSGIVFNDSNTSTAAEILLTVLLLIANISLVFYLLYKMYEYFDSFVIAKLFHINVQIPDGANFCQRVLLLMQGMANKIILPGISRFRAQRRARQEMRRGVGADIQLPSK